VSGLDLLAFIIIQGWMKETIQRRAPNVICAQVNPFPALKVFCSSHAIGALLAPHILADAARCVHSILFLYLIVKYQWTAIHIGAFFTAVGVKTVITQGLILPFCIPRYISVRTAVPMGTCIAGFEYAMYGVCTQGWIVVVILFACCLSTIEGASLDCLFSSLVPSQKQGRLNGAMSVVNTFTHAIMVPFFCFLFARCLSGRNPMAVANSVLPSNDENEDDAPERRLVTQDGLLSFNASTLIASSLNADSNEAPLMDSLSSSLLNVSVAAAATLLPLIVSTTSPTSAPTQLESPMPSALPVELPSVQSFGAYADESPGDLVNIIDTIFNATAMDVADMHLEIPFFVSSALFFSASIASILVLRCFPMLGCGDLKN
jgi:hypothetical protein